MLNDEDEEYELEKMKEEVIKKGGKIIEERKKSQQEPSKHSFMDSEDDSEDESDESDLEDKENSLSKKKADREYLPDDYDSSDTEEGIQIYTDFLFAFDFYALNYFKFYVMQGCWRSGRPGKSGNM